MSQLMAGRAKKHRRQSVNKQRHPDRGGRVYSPLGKSVAWLVA